MLCQCRSGKCLAIVSRQCHNSDVHCVGKYFAAVTLGHWIDNKKNDDVINSRQK